MSRLKKWRLKRAYKLVLKDLSRVSMFRGVYDAKNGDEHFMYGVQTVMEAIAFEADKLEFDKIFADNMTRSEIKVGIINE